MRRTRWGRGTGMGLVVLALAATATRVSAQAGDSLLLVEPPRAPGVFPPASAPRSDGRFNPLGIPGLTIGGAGAPPRAGRPNPSDVLVVPALFSDSEEPTAFPVSEIRRILFDGPSEDGTFVEFYREASRGLVEPDGFVSPWVQTDVTLLEAAGNEQGHGWVGERIRDYIVQAMQGADPYVDFRQFDNDGPDGIPNSGDDDGYVDAFVVEFREIAGSCGGPAIWPHFSAVFESSNQPGWPTGDVGASGQPIRIYTYLTESVTDCEGSAIQGPNVIAHEYGHLLGLPDVYQAIDGIEPNHRWWNVGCFGLMAAGSWGCGSGPLPARYGPVHQSIYMKQLLGWMPGEAVGSVLEKEYVLQPAETTGRGLQIQLPTGEFFLLEYRARIGFDAQLPTAGVLLYEVDSNFANRAVPEGLPPATRYHLIEADGDHALRKVEADGGNRGVPGDVFGIEGHNGPYSSAPGDVRLITHEGMPTTVTIHSVTVDGDVARIVLSTDATPTLMASNAAADARILESGTLATFRLAGGALPYDVTLDEGTEVEGTVVMNGTEGQVVGTPFASGTVPIGLSVTDALGTRVAVGIDLQVLGVDLELTDLVDAALHLAPSTGEAARFLDGQGNRNGAPDVGDLRAYLRRAGGS